MKYKIIEKAWIVYHEGMIKPGDIDFYQSISEIPVVYAQTRNKAKIKALYTTDISDWDLMTMSKQTNSYKPSYIDLKTKRVKGLDKIMFEDHLITVRSVETLIAQREKKNNRRKLFEKNYKDGFTFAISKGYVGNDLLFWKKGKSGYTTNLREIHLFSKQEILDHHIDNLGQNEIIWNTEDLINGAILVVNSDLINYKNCIR